MGKAARLKRLRHEFRMRKATAALLASEYEILELPPMPKRSAMHRGSLAELIPGNIVRLWGGVLNLRPVRAKYLHKFGDLLSFSIGDIQIVISSGMVQMEITDEPEPDSWLDDEISYLRDNIIRCPCRECQASLQKKLAERATLCNRPAAEAMN